MRIDMDLRRLRFFVDVVRQGGFSHAAKAVSATQPTVSKAVKHLEDELGVPLLRLLRCDEMQGYLISRPVPKERLLALLMSEQG